LGTYVHFFGSTNSYPSYCDVLFSSASNIFFIIQFMGSTRYILHTYFGSCIVDNLFFFDPSHLYMGWILENLISVMNAYVMWIERLPYSKISDLHLYSSEVLVMYLIQILILVAFRKKSFVRLVFGLLLIIFWQIINLFNHINVNERKMLGIYDMQDQMGIDLIEGYSARLMIDRYKSRSFERLKWRINLFCGFLGLPSTSTDLTELFKIEEL